MPPERGRIISGKVSTALGKPWPEKAGDPARPAPSTTAGTAKGAGLKKSSFKIKIEVAIPVTADLDDFARRRKEAETALKGSKDGLTLPQSRRRGGYGKRKATPEQAWKRFQEIEREHPEWNRTAIIQTVAEQYRVWPRSVRRWLEEYKKKAPEA